MTASSVLCFQWTAVSVGCVQEQYADETFVHVLPAGQIPHTRHVRGSNFVYISVFPDRLPGRAIIIAGEAASCGQLSLVSAKDPEKLIIYIGCLQPQFPMHSSFRLFSKSIGHQDLVQEHALYIFPPVPPPSLSPLSQNSNPPKVFKHSDCWWSVCGQEECLKIVALQCWTIW